MKNKLTISLAIFGILSLIFILVFTVSCSFPPSNLFLFSFFGLAAIGSVAGFTVIIVRLEKKIKEEEENEKGKENEEN